MPKIVGGGHPFPPEICVQSDPPPFKQRNFDQYRLIAPQPWLNEVGSLFLVFWSAYVRYRRKKFTFAISSPDEFLFALFSACAEPAQVDRFWRSIRHTTCFRPRMCLLGVSFILLPILGVKSLKNPILGAWIGIIKFNVQSIKICILLKLLHRLPPHFA